MENTDWQEHEQERFAAPGAFDNEPYRQHGQEGAYLHAHSYQNLRNAELWYFRCDCACAGWWPIREKEQHGENKLAYVQVEGINFENYTLITNFYGMLPFGGVIMQKILVVEDDLDIQELLKNFLQEVGYEIILASDGVEALSVFSVSQFDLVHYKSCFPLLIELY